MREPPFGGPPLRRDALNSLAQLALTAGRDTSSLRPFRSELSPGRLRAGGRQAAPYTPVRVTMLPDAGSVMKAVAFEGSIVTSSGKSKS
jgi:hypothetical protein